MADTPLQSKTSVNFQHHEKVSSLSKGQKEPFTVFHNIPKIISQAASNRQNVPENQVTYRSQQQPNVKSKANHKQRSTPNYQQTSTVQSEQPNKRILRPPSAVRPISQLFFKNLNSFQSNLQLPVFHKTQNAETSHSLQIEPRINTPHTAPTAKTTKAIDHQLFSPQPEFQQVPPTYRNLPKTVRQPRKIPSPYNKNEEIRGFFEEHPVSSEGASYSYSFLVGG